jgi:hypothetical protein
MQEFFLIDLCHLIPIAFNFICQRASSQESPIENLVQALINS